MVNLALAENKLGHHEEAEKIIAGAVERYPDGSDVRATAANILWQNKKYEDAAKLFSKGPGHNENRIYLEPWQLNYGVAFVDAFKKAPDADALAAFAMLRKAKIIDAALMRLSWGLCPPQNVHR